jgi:hypothetical protein
VPNVPERETVPVALEDGFTSRPCGVNYLASILLKVETSGSQHIPDEMVIYFSPCYCWFSGAAGNKAVTKTTWTINTLLNLFDE